MTNERERETFANPSETSAFVVVNQTDFTKTPARTRRLTIRQHDTLLHATPLLKQLPPLKNTFPVTALIPNRNRMNLMTNSTEVMIFPPCAASTWTKSASRYGNRSSTRLSRLPTFPVRMSPRQCCHPAAPGPLKTGSNCFSQTQTEPHTLKS